jgi:hypothetical protein
MINSRCTKFFLSVFVIAALVSGQAQARWFWQQPESFGQKAERIMYDFCKNAQGYAKDAYEYVKDLVIAHPYYTAAGVATVIAAYALYKKVQKSETVKKKLKEIKAQVEML